MKEKNLELEFEKDFRVCRYYLDDKYFSQTERRDSVWYDSDIILVLLNLDSGGYTAGVKACGDVRITNNETGDYVCSKGNNARNVCEFLERNGIQSDREFYKAQEEGVITVEDNNWFEINIKNHLTGEFITDGLDDTVVDPEVVDIDFIIKMIEYLEINSENLNEEELIKRLPY